jgi:predicted ATPase
MIATVFADLLPSHPGLVGVCSGYVYMPCTRYTSIPNIPLVEQQEERWWEAEVYRLRGVLLLRQTMPQPEEAEACFQRALDIARHQEAKSLELRAAMSLSRLWQQQGKRQEAYDLLVPIYGWFTEGFDTADLQEAKALLEALA